MGVDCPSLSLNSENCICASTDCLSKGMCCECVRNHRAHENLPACLRS